MMSWTAFSFNESFKNTGTSLINSAATSLFSVCLVVLKKSLAAVAVHSSGRLVLTSGAASQLVFAEYGVFDTVSVSN